MNSRLDEAPKKFFTWVGRTLTFVGLLSALIEENPQAAAAFSSMIGIRSY